MLRKNRNVRLNYKHLHYFWVVAREGGVVKAGKLLHVAPQTISSQLRQLESALGEALLERDGRSVRLTDAGRVALEYADDIFALGRELGEVLGQGALRRPAELRVGIADVMPKSIVRRLLQPALDLAPGLRLVCREQEMRALLAELAVHTLDVVIADSPIPAGVDIRGFNHRLGDSALTFFASRELARGCRGPFPGCMDGRPMLIPSDESALRGRVLQWLSDNGVTPRIVGEFDDSALMKSFGASGAGIFMAPAAIADEVCRHFGVRMLGSSPELRCEFFAISVERRITHPAVLAITGGARNLLPSG